MLFMFRDLPASERSWVGNVHIDHEVTYFGPVNTYTMKCSYFHRREVMSHLTNCAWQDSPAYEVAIYGYFVQGSLGSQPMFVSFPNKSDACPCGCGDTIADIQGVTTDVWSGNPDTDKFWR